MSSSLKSIFKTTPHDKVNFPSTNQSHHCWQRYNTYVLCLKKNGGDEDECKSLKQLAQSICPDDWMKTWDDQRAEGIFLGVQEKPISHDHNEH